MLYFAYGSNLHAADFARACRSNGHRADCMRALARAWLPDAEVVFNVHSRTRGGGVLNLRPRRGQAVPGLLFEVQEAGWLALDAKEGTPWLYARAEVTVLTCDGQAHRAQTYRVPAARVQARHTPPAPEYLQVVREGLLAHGHDVIQLEQAAAGLSPPIGVPGFFVYGTLMRGESNHAVLARHGIASAQAGQVRGELFDTGMGFPAMRLAQDASRVQGELIVPEAFEGALRAVDALEVFDGYGAAGNEYERRLIEVAPEGGGASCLAWAYFGGEGLPLQARIDSGSWRRARGAPHA